MNKNTGRTCGVWLVDGLVIKCNNQQGSCIFLCFFALVKLCKFDITGRLDLKKKFY
jgi:hypothetical protein